MLFVLVRNLGCHHCRRCRCHHRRSCPHRNRRRHHRRPCQPLVGTCRHHQACRRRPRRRHAGPQLSHFIRAHRARSSRSLIALRSPPRASRCAAAGLRGHAAAAAVACAMLGPPPALPAGAAVPSGRRHPAPSSLRPAISVGMRHTDGLRVRVGCGYLPGSIELDGYA